MAHMNRTRAYDRQWRLIWDSDTATTPLYDHISTEVNAIIDHPNGYRWSGMFYRCPEGVKRMKHIDPLKYLTWPTNPFLESGPNA